MAQAGSVGLRSAGAGAGHKIFLARGSVGSNHALFHAWLDGSGQGSSPGLGQVLVWLGLGLVVWV